MAENTFNAETDSRCSEAICIDARRVFDSCGDKDCLSDLPTFFTAESQALIDNAVNVRVRDAEVADVIIDTESMPFHRGFYSIDITYYFILTLDVYSAPGTAYDTVTGLCISDKKVILYGSDGNVKVFSSEYSSGDRDTQRTPATTMPVANVQAARPIALASALTDKLPSHRLTYTVPQSVINALGGEVTDEGTRTVLATLGVFSIVQLTRNVQMLIPSYDYCIPEKSCAFNDDSPCEMFSRLDFPTDEFFPPNISDPGTDGGCGCSGSCGETTA